MPGNSLRRYAACRLGLFIVALSILACGCSVVKPAPGVAPWDTYLYDGARTNYSQDVFRLPVKRSWSKDLSDFRIFRKFPKEQLSSPAISGGVVYAGSTNNRFYALNQRSGFALWRFDAGYPLESQPAVAGELVCFGGGSGVVRCLDRETGREAWSFQARSEVLGAPLVKDGRIYFYSSDDRLYAVDLKTGRKIWTYTQPTFQTVAPRLSASPASEDGKDKIYQLFSDGTLVCLKADSGKVIWSNRVVKNFDAAQKTRRTPLLHDGAVYIIDDANSILALDENTGEGRGNYGIMKAYDFIIAGKRRMIIAGLDQIVAFDYVSGSILWRKDLHHNPLQSVFAAGDYLFVLSNYTYAPLGIKFLSKTKGHIQAISIKDGSEAWGKTFSSVVTANGSASDGRIALLLNDGTLEVFRSK